MVKVMPSSLSSLYIEWDQDGDSFTILKSTSPDDGFEVLADGVLQPMFEDTDVNLYSEGVRYYYRIEGYTSGSKVSDSESATWEYNVRDGVAHKAIHESKVVLRAMRNPPVFLLIKRRTGGRCPDCWNTVTNKVKYSNCPTCNSTGYVGGYHPPISTLMSRDVSQVRMASSEFDGDKNSLTPIRAWIANTPILYPDDVVVTSMNERYKVVNVAPRTRSQYIIRQIIDLVPLEKGHPAFNVEVAFNDSVSI